MDRPYLRHKHLIQTDVSSKWILVFRRTLTTNGGRVGISTDMQDEYSFIHSSLPLPALMQSYSLLLQVVYHIKKNKLINHQTRIKAKWTYIRDEMVGNAEIYMRCAVDLCNRAIIVFFMIGNVLSDSALNPLMKGCSVDWFEITNSKIWIRTNDFCFLILTYQLHLKQHYTYNNWWQGWYQDSHARLVLQHAFLLA